MIEKIEKNLALLDAYGDLLTAKQKEIFTNAYSDDLSLSEIGENMEISRSAVFDTLKRTLAILENYESKLHLVKKATKRERLYKMALNSEISLETLIEDLRRIDEEE